MGEADRVAFAGTSRFEVVRRLGEGGMGLARRIARRLEGEGGWPRSSQTYQAAHRPLHAQAVRLRLGALGRALVEGARAFLRAEKVRAPDRLANLLVPVGREA